MAHVEKYTRGAMGNMLAHYNRTRASSKSLIATERTHLNYNLADADQPFSQLDFIHKRLSEIKVLNRKDVNFFCDWIVTAPQELMENEYANLFSETYNFLNDRYGKENVISAYVHMDESQPHIHYAFIPVAMDKKKNIPKLSAKEVITLKELKVFHKDLSTHLNGIFGRDIGILNGATDLGNQTIKQLRNSSKNLKSYADTEIQTTTNIITKAMGKDKVLVSQSDIIATQQAAADTAALMKDINAANKNVKIIREKAERNFAKSEKILSELTEREKAIAEREDSIARREHENKTVSQQKDIDRANISERLKICQEREQQLELCENSPHKFYGDKIAKLNEENSSLKESIAELKSENSIIQENTVQLNIQLAEKEKAYTKRLADKEREVAAEYETHLREKDGIIKSLKAAVDKVYYIICNICRATAVLWCGKGKFADYAMDFSAKQNALMCAILDYGAKSAREADFSDLAEKIDNEYFICSDIREEMIAVEPKTLQHKNDYPSL